MRALCFLLLMLFCGEAAALSVVGAHLECTRKKNFKVIVEEHALLTMGVGQDSGIPGLVYLAAHNPITNRTIFYNLSNRWEVWTDGPMPIYQVMRDGISDLSIDVPINMKMNALIGNDLYVGYGLYTESIRREVEMRRAALEKMKADRPGQAIYDPGDDYVRRLLIEREMKKNNRYVKILKIVGCKAMY